MASPGPLTTQPMTATVIGLPTLVKCCLDLLGQRDQLDLDAAAGGAGDQRGAVLAQAERVEDVPADRYLFRRVRGQRDADRVADALRQQHADADGAAHGAGARRARLGDAEVQRVRRAALVQDGASCRLASTIVGTSNAFIDILMLS